MYQLCFSLGQYYRRDISLSVWNSFVLLFRLILCFKIWTIWNDRLLTSSILYFLSPMPRTMCCNGILFILKFFSAVWNIIIRCCCNPVSQKKHRLALLCLICLLPSCLLVCRLSTVVNCDKILVLEGGTLVESGTHAELLAKPASKYAGQALHDTAVGLSVVQCCGSGIRCVFYPWIRDPGQKKTRIRDLG
jgi:hypothetical protein